MRILTYRTNLQWQSFETIEPREEPSRAPEGLGELHRVLSDVFRCSNLVILTGLGTSMHVNVDAEGNGRVPMPGKSLAPSMQDLWNAARDRDTVAFEQILVLSKFPANEQGNIEALLSYCRVAGDFQDSQEATNLIDTFVAATEAIIRDKVRFVSDSDDLSTHADFLRRLIRRSDRKARPKLFTTNYDLCFEYAARHGRYLIVDGFSHSTPQVFDSLYFSYDVVRRNIETDSLDLVPNVFQLYKLHGSVDWTMNETSHEIERDPATDAPLLVYPRNSKYELAFSQPYLEMMSALQAALRQSDTGLLILGFGFNDNHIAEPVLAAIRSNLSLQVVVCDPSLGPQQTAADAPALAGAETTNPHLGKIEYLVRQGDARLALVSARFQEIVPNLPDIAAETDLEQHLERLRNLRAYPHAT